MLPQPAVDSELPSWQYDIQMGFTYRASVLTLKDTQELCSEKEEEGAGNDK